MLVIKHLVEVSLLAAAVVVAWAFNVPWEAGGLAAAAFFGALIKVLRDAFRHREDWNKFKNELVHTAVIVLVATGAGIIFAGAVVRYLAIEHYEYKALAFFASGLGSLGFCLAFVTVTDTDSTQWVRRIADGILRVFVGEAQQHLSDNPHPKPGNGKGE